LNSNSDPGDFNAYVQQHFASYSQVDPVTQEFQAEARRHRAADTRSDLGKLRGFCAENAQLDADLSAGGAGPPIAPPTQGPAGEAGIDCPGEIPPPTMNIFGMPHPTIPGRVIIKFTSIDESTLNGRFGITRELIRQKLSAGENVALKIAELVRAEIDEATPNPDPVKMGQAAADAYAALLNQVQTSFTTAFNAALAAAGSPTTADAVYNVIRDTVYRGLDCQDVTFALSGTFSHAAVSSFLSVTGKGTLSTTGAAGVSGVVNFVGMPVGEGKVFLTATDANGNPNPAVSGDIHVALGPLEFGTFKGIFDSRGAVTALLSVFNNFVQALGPEVTNEILAQMNSAYAGKTFEQIYADAGGRPMSANEIATFKVAFIGHVLQLPPSRLGATVKQNLVTLVSGALSGVNPELVLCGEVAPKLFGLQTSNGFLDAKMRLRKTGREAYFATSPSLLISYLLRCETLFSGFDEASYAYAEQFPDVTAVLTAGLNGKLSSPAETLSMAREQARSMLENSVIAGSYKLNPLGMTLGQSTTRIINPDLTDHPVLRTTAWVPPDVRDPALPSRIALLQAAVGANKLGDVFWKGKAGELTPLFPSLPSADQAKLAPLSLTHDYFPHGGVVMASKVLVPRILSSLPREEWTTLNNPDASTPNRLGALQTIIQRYILEAEERGTFTAYVPAPNPPALFDANGQKLASPPVLDPKAMFESLRSFDPTKLRLGSLYPVQQGFIYTQISGQLFDVPIGSAMLAASPGDTAQNQPPRFEGSVKVPSGSWLEPFLGAADLRVSLAGQHRANVSPDSRPLIAEKFKGLLDRSAVAGASFGSLRNEFLSALNTDFPRAEIRATVSAPGIPSALQSMIRWEAGAGAEFYAYSPEYLSDVTEASRAVDQLKKSGGIAMTGHVKFGNVLAGEAMLRIQPQLNGTPRVTSNVIMTNAPLPGGLGTVGRATVTFDSAPAAGKPFLIATGAIVADVNVSAMGWNVRIPAGASATVRDNTITFAIASDDANGDGDGRLYEPRRAYVPVPRGS
jgi:hypothetical protein